MSASASSSGTSALLLHCGAIPLANPRTKDQVHDLLRYLSGHSKPKLVKRRTSIYKLEQELLLNLNPKPKVEEIALQEHVTDAVISRRLVSFDRVATQGGMSRLGSHPASCGQLMRVYPLLGDGCSRHTHSSAIPASLHAMGFKTSPPELVTIRECEEYVIPYPRLPCDITASIYTLYKLKPGAILPAPRLNMRFSPLEQGHVDSDIDINGKASGSRSATLLLLPDSLTSLAAAYEPVDRNFDAIELSAECSVAYVDVMASELQVCALCVRLCALALITGTANCCTPSARGFCELLQVFLLVVCPFCPLMLLVCSLQDLLPLLPRKL